MINKIDKQIVNYKVFAIIAMWLCAAMVIVAVIYALKVSDCDWHDMLSW